MDNNEFALQLQNNALIDKTYVHQNLVNFDKLDYQDVDASEILKITQALSDDNTIDSNQKIDNLINDSKNEVETSSKIMMNNISYNPVDINAQGFQFDQTNPDHVGSMQAHLAQTINPQTNLPYYMNKAGTQAGAVDLKWGGGSQKGYEAYQASLGTNVGNVNTTPQNDSVDKNAQLDINESEKELINTGGTSGTSGDDTGIVNDAFANQSGAIETDDETSASDTKEKVPEWKKALREYEWESPTYGSWK
tara:strand:- start:3842 stop:4591 length:750 start_codon:yes stop_codon:yes gene_type:complete